MFDQGDTIHKFIVITSFITVRHITLLQKSQFNEPHKQNHSQAL